MSARCDRNKALPSVRAPTWPELTGIGSQKNVRRQNLAVRRTGGCKYGQYWLNVKFAQSVVRVPFRLLTEEEERTLGRNFGDIKKQVEAAFRKKS